MVLKKFVYRVSCIHSQRAPSVEDMEQEGKRGESEPNAAASIPEPSSRSEGGHEEEVIRKLSAPASEASSEARSPHPVDSNTGTDSCDLFEAAAEDLAFFTAAATGRSHSDAWSPSQQRRSGRLPFSPVFPLDEEEKEGESKGAGDGGGIRLTEEQELTVLETGGGEEAVDGEPLGESEAIPAEEGGDCALGGVATSPRGDSSAAVGEEVSPVPVAVDAGDIALPVSTSEGTNMVSSDLIGGDVGREQMSVDVTMAVGEASGAGSSALPSPGLETGSGVVNMEDEVTVAVEERGEARAEIVCEEVEERGEARAEVMCEEVEETVR